MEVTRHTPCWPVSTTSSLIDRGSEDSTFMRLASMTEAAGIVKPELRTTVSSGNQCEIGLHNGTYEP